MVRLRYLLACPMALFCTPVFAQQPLDMAVSLTTWSTQINSTPVLYTHTRGAAPFGAARLMVRLSRASNPAPAAPYQLRVELSPGFLDVSPHPSHPLPAGMSCQPPQGGGYDPLVLDCVMTNPIGGLATELQFRVDTGSTTQFGGATGWARATLDYDAHPLPGTPVCIANQGNTGCVLRQVPVFDSTLSLTGMSVAGGSMIMGQESNIRIDSRVLGFDSLYQTTFDVDLPTGLQYVGVTNPIGASPTCNVNAMGGGQRVTCVSTGHYSSNGTGTPRDIQYDLRVRPMAPLQPPGPVDVIARVGNAVQLPPDNCAAQPSQPRCAQVSFALTPPLVVALQFTAATAPEPWLALARPQPLQLRFRNNGGLAASQTRLLAKLPAGFGYVSAQSPHGVTCAAAGSLEDGQQVTCLQGTLAASMSRDLTLTVQGDPWLTAPTDNVAVFAVTDGSTLDGPALLACAANPEPDPCTWLEFTVRAPCPDGPDDSVYCDDFEVFQ